MNWGRIFNTGLSRVTGYGGGSEPVRLGLRPAASLTRLRLAGSASRIILIRAASFRRPGEMTPVAAAPSAQALMRRQVRNLHRNLHRGTLNVTTH